MIKIYQTDTYDNPTIDDRMWLDLNAMDYALVTNPFDADMTLGWCDVDRPHLVLNIWHNFENQMHPDNWHHWMEYPNVSIVTNVVDQHSRDCPRVYFNDFLWNRTKAYYSDFAFAPDTRKWYYIDRACYTQCDLDQPKQATRIFLSPLRLHLHLKNRTVTYRKWLYHHLLNFADRGFTSQRTLYSHLDRPEHCDTNELGCIAESPIFVPPGYTPPHNAYYRESFVSIYTETIEYGTSLAITEKTWDPLIKGHFVLPFSAPGFVAHLRSQGVRLPNFIDYSYDLINNDDKRYCTYENEATRLIKIPIERWHELWYDNLDIVKHNQNLLSTKPYDRVDIKQFLLDHGKL